MTEAVAAAVGGPELDAGALEAVGIGLEAVRSSVEATSGPGALDRPRRSGRQPAGHIALALLRGGDGLAVKVLHDRGVDADALRADLRLALDP
ncbi:Clp protease N-terminal domain-containing protein [Blastococcus capsensis]|uniref:Clp protease N-terminal domain-containing protein n=1 Tax=Blastococcus capsensis TaxID=1564163 RepID=UPI002541FB4D|nr:Clp protease N-terminal domain-containing protein [Blastococcus capsensis]MDK3256812.1 Clp protease N-terminal domain-containing protein [Blastococcus capsensis]